jgi:hypothetical protein
MEELMPVTRMHNALTHNVQATRSNNRYFRVGNPDIPASIGVIERTAGISLPTHMAIPAEFENNVSALTMFGSKRLNNLAVFNPGPISFPAMYPTRSPEIAPSNALIAITGMPTSCWPYNRVQVESRNIPDTNNPMPRQDSMKASNGIRRTIQLGEACSHSNSIMMEEYPLLNQPVR